jgi:hypothetical protein
MEIVQDHALLKEVQAEADTAFQVDASTGKRVLDVQKMLGFPLLQSVYAEALRLHVSVNLTREVVGATATVAGYKLPNKSLIQAPTRIALYDERAWGVDGHPASRFWAHRHIKYVETQDDAGKTARTAEFSLAAGPNDFIPYGTSHVISLLGIVLLIFGIINSQVAACRCVLGGISQSRRSWPLWLSW